MKKLLLAAVFSAFASSTFAADMSVKARSFTDPIPLNGCGWMYGLNAAGDAGKVVGSPVPGDAIIQGQAGFTLGYTCANQANTTFWFADADFDIANINGDTAGVAFTGPWRLSQRLGFGGPLSAFLNLFPALGTISTPSLPILPPGVTAGPGQVYFYVGLNEQDVSARFQLASNREFLVAPEIGVGSRYRLSNAVVGDVFAGVVLATKGICVGNFGCPGMGTLAHVGFKFLY